VAIWKQGSWLFETVKDAARWTLDRAYSCKPMVQNRVVFSNFAGKGYGGNPKYVAEALRGKGLDLVWLLNYDRTTDLPEGVRSVRYDSVEAWEALQTAKVVVNNVRYLHGYKKRKNQLYIQTWHGYLWTKRVEKDVEELLNPDYLHDAQVDGARTDIMFAGGDIDAAAYKRAFWYRGPVVRCGMPRMAPVMNPPAGLRERVCRRLGVDPDKRLVLFAPTFRDWDKTYYPPFDPLALTAQVDARFGGHHVIVGRLHPNTAALMDFGGASGMVDACSYPDVQELISAADVVITDYSSVCIDAMLGGKPVFLYAPDLERYLATPRKPYADIREAPFPLVTTEGDLRAAIAGFDLDQMRRRYAAFKRKFGYCEDGRGAEVVAGLVMDVIGGENVKEAVERYAS
jgi:CDP-glycerol glycerophosphotransferase